MEKSHCHCCICQRLVANILTWPVLDGTNCALNVTLCTLREKLSNRSIINVLPFVHTGNPEENNHAPKLVPWGTPAGRGPHAEIHSPDNLTRCYLCVTKSATQKATARGIDRPKPLRTSSVWSMRSKAFLQSNRMTLTAAPDPSVACNRVCSMDVRACKVEDAGMPRHWFGSITSRTAGPTWRATIKSYANLDISGARKIERRCLLMSDFSLGAGTISAIMKDDRRPCSAKPLFSTAVTGLARMSAYSFYNQLGAPSGLLRVKPFIGD